MGGYICMSLIWRMLYVKCVCLVVVVVMIVVIILFVNFVVLLGFFFLICSMFNCFEVLFNLCLILKELLNIFFIRYRMIGVRFF